MEKVANIVALCSLILYVFGILNKKNSVMLLCFAIGDFVYAMSYVLLKNYLTASTFILGIILSLVLAYMDYKNKKCPIILYVLFEIAEIISCALTFKIPADILVLTANIIFVFFACYNDVKLLKYATLLFGIFLLIYNILIAFTTGIIIESFITVITVIEIVKISKLQTQNQN